MTDNTDNALSRLLDQSTGDLDRDSPDRTHGESLHVDDPGQLIVAVPAMIGFVPERSLVVALLRDSDDRRRAPTIDAVLRLDLDIDDSHPGRADAYADAVVSICATEDATVVLAVIVDDRMSEPRDTQPPAGSDLGPWARLIAAFSSRLAGESIVVAGAWAVRAIEPWQGWWGLLGPNSHGTLPDPATSMVTLAHVLRGRPIRGTRSELTELLTPDTELATQVAADLDEALRQAHDRYAEAVRRGDPDSYHRRMLEWVLWRVADTDSGIVLTAGEYAELAAALRDRMVRDSLFALAVGEHAAPAERLWVASARALSGCDRADAATLLAYSAYLRGDGPLAGIALQAARHANPTHSMAILLETSLRAGIRPHTVRTLAHTGRGIAADLGVDLGPIHH
ncbi:DUF4192 domain-containing protein [Nocardia vinacea]|uniref:DUF4192 domain-containing protein n=1 Tax=Nocardia vinacea TaxID=96468 RepID=UPI002E1373B3|nr:DUF4192 domain-containing protein [Nocardia vinacea]